MISLNVVLYIFVALFGTIGAIRGMRKELAVVLSGFLALIIIQELLPRFFESMSGTNALILNLVIIFICGVLGYQTPAIHRFSESGRFERTAPIDTVMGFLVGTFNGYLLIGSAWFFIAKAGYPFNWITAPDAATESGKQAINLLQFMLPDRLNGPWMYVAIVVAGLLIIGVIL